MCDELPQSVDPRRLADLNRGFSGHLSLERLPRLAAVVEDSVSGEPYASFMLRFEHDAAGRDIVRGSVSSRLSLRCQRCNEPFEFPVSSSFVLALVQGLDQAALLPDLYDPLLPDETKVDPAALIEDELLLALPAVPRHPEGACRPPESDAGETQPQESARTDNPFAVLDKLKRQR
jgi:uncharacterized protein